MKYYIIAGEASGDLHGSNLIRALKARDSKAEIRAWGGDLMEDAGAKVVKHYRDLAFMGFAEVIANLRTILKNFDICKADLQAYRPDVLILIDYPGFNLRMAKFAHTKGIKVFYYISPQIWAWKQSRVKQIRAYVDEMYVILPFEKEFYARFNVDVHFVGHPLIDAVNRFKEQASSRAEFLEELGFADDKPIIALLPGSRKQEIAKMLPLMLKVGAKFPQYRFIVAGAPSQDPSFYEGLMPSARNIIFGQTYKLLSYSHAAMVTSGTATLETAIFKVPQVVCYKGGTISYLIARSLVKVKYISLVNLIMDREVVVELIQADFNEKKLTLEFGNIAEMGENRTRILEDYNLLHEKLGGIGASELTADLMLKTLQAPQNDIAS